MNTLFFDYDVPDSQSLERRSQIWNVVVKEQRVHGGRLKFTLIVWNVVVKEQRVHGGSLKFTLIVWNVVVKEQRVHGGRLKFTLMCIYISRES